jgi:O-antigen ligase
MSSLTLRRLISLSVFLTGSIIGITAALSSNQVLFGALALGFCLVFLLILVQLGHRSHYALTLVIISTTVAREKLGSSIEFDAIAIALLAAMLILSGPTQFFRHRVYVLGVPMIGYLAVSFLSSYVNSPIPDVSLRQALILTYRAITFYLVIITVLEHPDLRMRYPIQLQRLLILHTLLSLVALLVLPEYLPLFLRHRVTGGTSISGFFQEPNLFGIFVLCVVSLTLPMYIFETSKRWVRLFPIIAIGLVGLLFSYTRSTWLGFGLILGCLGILTGFGTESRVRKRYALIVLVLGLALSIGLSLLFLHARLFTSSSGLSVRLAERLSEIIDAKSGTAVFRINTWNEGFRLWQSHPWLGRGLLAYMVDSPRDSGWLFNFALQSLHDSGILGTLFMIWLYIGCLYYPLKAYRVASDERDKGILLGYVLAQIALYFTSLFSAFTWSAFSWVLLGLSTGHSLVVMRQARLRQSSAKGEGLAVPLV